MENSEEQKQAFLTKMAKQFLNEAVEDGYDLSEIEDLSFRLMYIMVRFAYMKAIPKDDMSDEEWNEVHEISALFSIAHYGKGCEKDIRSKGLSYGEVKKAISLVFIVLVRKSTVYFF